MEDDTGCAANVYRLRTVRLEQTEIKITSEDLAAMEDEIKILNPRQF